MWRTYVRVNPSSLHHYATLALLNLSIKCNCVIKLFMFFLTSWLWRLKMWRNCFQSTLLSSSLIDSLASRCLYCTSESLMQKWSSTRRNSAWAILPFLVLSNAVNAWNYESTRKVIIQMLFVLSLTIELLHWLIKKIAAQCCTTPFSPRLVKAVDPTLDRVSKEFVTSSLTFCKALSGLRFSTLSPENIMYGLTGEAITDLLLTLGPRIRSRKSWYDSLQTSSPRLQEKRGENNDKDCVISFYYKISLEHLGLIHNYIPLDISVCFYGTLQYLMIRPNNWWSSIWNPCVCNRANRSIAVTWPSPLLSNSTRLWCTSSKLSFKHSL